jgi:hypothetical protein
MICAMVEVMLLPLLLLLLLLMRILVPLLISPLSVQAALQMARLKPKVMTINNKMLDMAQPRSKPKRDTLTNYSLFR